VSLARYVLDAVPAQRESTLNLLVVGSKSTANEPWQLATYSVPTMRKVLEGRSATIDRRHQLLVDIQSKFRAIARTDTSPIFLGVKQAVADLRAHGCTGDSQCKLWVDSDLAENVDPTIFIQLNGRRSKLPPLVLAQVTQ
jgi:hypothetical protein